ncbi:hypothetical protein GCM10027280_07670 [Micromonospora polyrhachis]
MTPEPGDVLRIDGAASVQFRGECALVFRVISVCKKDTYRGWAWITGYVLDQAGLAVEKREIFVMKSGLRPVASKPAAKAVQGRRV